MRDSFFDLGGDSVMIVQLHQSASNNISPAQFPIATLFEHHDRSPALARTHLTDNGDPR